MYIGTHSKAISNSIFAVIFEWLNMRSLQNLRHCHIGDYATLASLEDFLSESSLVGASGAERLDTLSFNF